MIKGDDKFKAANADKTLTIYIKKLLNCLAAFFHKTIFRMRDQS